MSSDPRPDIVCAVCRRPLDRHLTVDGMSWRHASTALHDHDPVPVDRVATGGELVGVCDFCSAPGPAWTYPCTDFTVDDPALPDVYTSEGAWAACDACHRLVGWGDWSGLADRAARRWPPQIRKPMRDAARLIQAGFREHRSGDPVRLWEER